MRIAFFSDIHGVPSALATVIGTLRAQVAPGAAKMPALALAAKVLPFNFR